MNIQELIAGGIGSGCNPRAGKCGRNPDYKGAIAHFKKLGYKVHSKETTQGAHKTWMDPKDINHKKATTKQHVKEYATKNKMRDLSDYSFDDEEEYLDNNHSVTRQGRGLLITKFRPGRAGALHRYGYDN